MDNQGKEGSRNAAQAQAASLVGWSSWSSLAWVFVFNLLD